MTSTRKLTYSALFLSFGVILPQIFHLFGGTGPIFLPMHIPVLLAGFFLGAPFGAAVGILSPLLSSALTGMPQFPILLFMIGELAAYGFFAGYFYKHRKLNIYVSLIGAMILGRVVMALVIYVLQFALGLQIQPLPYVITAIAAGLPGIAIQFIFLPPMVRLLHRAARYDHPEP